MLGVQHPGRKAAMGSIRQDGSYLQYATVARASLALAGMFP